MPQMPLTLRSSPFSARNRLTTGPASMMRLSSVAGHADGSSQASASRPMTGWRLRCLSSNVMLGRVSRLVRVSALANPLARGPLPSGRRAVDPGALGGTRPPALPEIILRCSESGPARTRWSAAGIFIPARLLPAGALLRPCIGRNHRRDGGLHAKSHHGKNEEYAITGQEKSGH
jgi:hypothetical protein